MFTMTTYILTQIYTINTIKTCKENIGHVKTN